MSTFETLKLEKKDHIASVIFNRPQKRNTATPGFFAELKLMFEEIDQDPEIRVVILRGEGKSFCAGLDLQEAAGLFEPSTPASSEKIRQLAVRWQGSMDAIEFCRKPVIAAVHSHCIGAGVDIISACDIRVASKDAVFSVRETRMAMIADLGTLQRLQPIVGDGWFRELALTGRDFDAALAKEMGLLTHLCEDQEEAYREAEKIAEEIASNSPLAVQATKDVLIHTRDQGFRSGLAYAAQKQATVIPSEDLMEAFQAFMEKRKPNFKGK